MTNGNVKKEMLKNDMEKKDMLKKDAGTTKAEEEKKQDWRLLKRLFPYLKKRMGLVIFTIFLMLVMDVAGVLHPYLVKVGIDRDVAARDLSGLAQTVLYLLLTVFVAFLFMILFNYAVQYLGQKLLYDLRLDLFRHMIYLSNDYFDKTAVGKTLTNITNDVESIREFISQGVVSVIGELLKVFFIFIAMMAVNIKLAFLAFTMIPIFVVVTLYFRKSIRTGYRGVRKANSEINTALQESITGIREIIQFNYKNKSKETFEDANKYYLVSFLKVVHAYALYFPVIEIVANISMVIILFFAHTALNVSIHIGEIFAFFAYITMFFRPLRQLAERFNMFQSAMAAAERTFRLLDRKVTVKEPAEPLPVPEKILGNIVFKNVHFAYKPETPVLRDVSFEIRPGEKVALVGYTGSGKTTIINLINRFYDIQSGEILVDGIPVNRFSLPVLRRRISTVPQDPFIFTGTVFENISMHDPSISFDQVVEATRQVNADKFIDQLPLKYDEPVLEEGKRLSVGQKQLLSFARGIVHEPDILILDEATSSIDSETEQWIDTAIERLLENRTAIIIAHRLSTIRKVDRILVFNKGMLVEEGNHRELLEKNGIYSRLYQSQAFALN